MKLNDATRLYRRPHCIRKINRVLSSIRVLWGLSQTHKTGEVVSQLLARTPYFFVQEFNAESEVCVDELVHRLDSRIGFEEILSFPSAMRERVMAVTGVAFALWTRWTGGTLDAYSRRTCREMNTGSEKHNKWMGARLSHLNSVMLKWDWLEYGCHGVAMRLIRFERISKLF